jgi:hypothetical protein
MQEGGIGMTPMAVHCVPGMALMQEVEVLCESW